MKKYNLLFLLFLFAVTSLSQTERRKTPVTGLGEFQFAMTREEVYQQVEKHATEDTKIFDKVEDVIQATNLEFAGYTFSSCSFNFRKDGLYFITFGSLRDKKSAIATAFDELTDVFNNLYGKWQYKTIGQDDVEMETLSWNDKQGGTLVISRYYIDEQDTALINIGASKAAQ